MCEEMRIAKYLNEDKEWETILPKNIKDGMYIKLFEPDGTEVLYGGNKIDYFVVVGDPYLNNENVWEFHVRI